MEVLHLWVEFAPYKATNIQDFWQRWHITLSRFLKDYVYIPLGGNRKGGFRTYTNLMATFILGGLWHGAGWTFVFWGFLHGLALVIHRAWHQLGFRLWTWLAWLITFNFVNIAWVFFRAKEWDDALKVLGGMFGLDNVVLPSFLASKLAVLGNYGVEFDIVEKNLIVWLSVGFLLVLVFKNSIEKVKTFKPNLYHSLFMISLLIMSILMLSKESEFLYFNF
jgi:alginate O-acetyltransferase complex protein AlgI